MHSSSTSRFIIKSYQAKIRTYTSSMMMMIDDDDDASKWHVTCLAMQWPQFYGTAMRNLHPLRIITCMNTTLITFKSF